MSPVTPSDPGEPAEGTANRPEPLLGSRTARRDAPAASASSTPISEAIPVDPGKGGGSRARRPAPAELGVSQEGTPPRTARATGQVRELQLSNQTAKPERRAPLEADHDGAASAARVNPATRAALDPFTVDHGRYFYRDRIAFVDQGKSITAHDTTARTARAIVGLAGEKGWRGVEVEGSAAFQRQVFIEASAGGIKVALRDYQPTPEDRALVELRLRAPLADVRPATRTSTAPRTEGTVRPAKDPVVVDFGRAPYEFREGADASYYLRTRTDEGRERVQWGKQLEAAIKQADAQAGDRVRVERTGSEAVQVAARRVKADGRWETVKVETMRNTFRIEVTERPRETARSAPAAAVEQALRGQAVPQATIDRTLRAFDNAERRAAERGVTIEARGYDPAAPRVAPAPTIQPGHERSHTRTR